MNIDDYLDHLAPEPTPEQEADADEKVWNDGGHDAGEEFWNREHASAMRRIWAALDAAGFSDRRGKKTIEECIGELAARVADDSAVGLTAEGITVTIDLTPRWWGNPTLSVEKFAVAVLSSTLGRRAISSRFEFDGRVTIEVPVTEDDTIAGIAQHRGFVMAELEDMERFVP